MKEKRENHWKKFGRERKWRVHHISIIKKNWYLYEYVYLLRRGLIKLFFFLIEHARKNRFSLFGLIFLLKNDLGFVIGLSRFLSVFFVFSSENEQKNKFLEYESFALIFQSLKVIKKNLPIGNLLHDYLKKILEKIGKKKDLAWLGFFFWGWMYWLAC